MAGEINIPITADVNNAIAGLKQVETQTQRTFQKVTQSSGAATQSMINLSRVVQDAPYGFIGIANNLNPLLESFQRLKEQSGTTGNAFKQLASSLVGPAGIGLAVGVISSLLVKYGDALFNAFSNTKALTEEQKKYNENVKNAISSVTQEAAKVETLVSFIKLETTTKKERNNAIKELQSLAPGYFANLNAEKSSIQDITLAYDNYLLSLRRSIEARVIEKDLQDTIAKRLELEKKLNVGRPVETAVKNGKVVVTAYNAIYATTSEVNDITKELNQTRQKELDLSKQLAILQPPKLKAQDFKEQKVDTNKIINDAKQLAKELEKIGVITPKFSETQTEQQQLKLAKDFIAKFKGAKLEFNVIPKIKFEDIDVPPLTGEAGMSDAEKQAERDGAILGQAFIDGRNKVLTTGFILTPEALNARKTQEGIDNLVKLGKDGASAVNEAIQSLKFEGLASIGEAIGAAFSGGDIKSVFQSFANTVSSVIVALGKQLIGLGLAAKATKDALKTLFANPIAMVAAGIGLVAIGSAIRGAIGKGIQAREKGGPVSGNTPYLVGERGPELFIPSVGGSIIPNNRMSSFSGRPAFASSMGGRSMVRGNDILLAYARTQRSQNRVNG